MNHNCFSTCGFIGLGLIGGSIAHAIKEHYPFTRIIAYDPDTQSIALAMKQGILSYAAAAIDESFSDCDCIFLCAPVSDNATNLLSLKKVMSPDCLLTDVGSVKTDIHHQIRKAGLDRQFIGGHPMAGSERVGFVNSKSLLLQNAYYILTPEPAVSSETVSCFHDFIQSLGAIPMQMSCEEHDYVTAAISHLPHVVSACLVNLVAQSDSRDGIMKTIAAGGFKDITRISSSSPAMWQQICLTNKDNILNLLNQYIGSLQKITQIIQSSSGEQIFDFFHNAQIYRDSFSETSSGPIKKSYIIRVEIDDRPGALASVAQLLAEHHISIKNIGISHNREQTDGVLQIELYHPEGTKDALELLKNKGYITYTP